MSRLVLYTAISVDMVYTGAKSKVLEDLFTLKCRGSVPLKRSTHNTRALEGPARVSRSTQHRMYRSVTTFATSHLATSHTSLNFCTCLTRKGSSQSLQINTTQCVRTGRYVGPTRKGSSQSLQINTTQCVRVSHTQGVQPESPGQHNTVCTGLSPPLRRHTWRPRLHINILLSQNFLSPPQDN
ncbi:hypothetical protein J6590_005776 [Homalodisca vitripennis]|nr:hypothetical protein J6590_005776 [Homalodisca vitripennis]